MSFSGDLRGIGLADVFQNVAANRTTGTLRVKVRRDERYVRFADGGVVGFSLGVGKGLPMIELLCARGRIDEAEVERVLARGRRSRKAKTLQCVEAGLIDDEALRAAMLERISEELFELFNLREAEFAFDEGDPPGRVFDSEQQRIGVRLEVGPILMEAARRRDDGERISKVVGSDQDVFVLLEGLDTESIDDFTLEVAELLDGRTSVEAIVRLTTAAPFQVRKAIFELVQLGAARPASVDELTAVADEALAAGDVNSAIGAMSRALEVARNDHVLRARFAELLEQVGRPGEAAVEHARLGHDAARQGDFPAALDAYDRAVAATPDDIALREKRVELLAEFAEDEQLVPAVIELADVQLAIGLAERARSMIATLVPVRRFERRRDIVEAWARIEAALGHWREAAGLLRGLGESLIATDERAGIELLRAAALQDPENAELARRIDEIQSGQHTRRRALRRRLGIAASVASVLGALGTAGVVEMTAARRAAVALGAGLGDLREGAGIDALEALQGVASSFGWTPTGQRAAEWSDRVLDLQLAAIRERIVATDFDRAEELCRELEARVPRADVGPTCDALVARIGRERAAFRVLDRIERQRDRASTTDLEALAALGSGEHLEFLIAHVTAVRDHEARVAMLEALARIDSPRAFPAVVHVLLTCRDDGSRRAARAVLASVAEHRAAGRESDWAAVLPELERALDDPEHGALAHELLAQLDGARG